MKYREMGKTGEKVSALGFGCMRFPTLDGDNSKIDEVKSTEMLEYALSNGVNYYDTAYPYHSDGTNQGSSEFFVGKVLKPHRDKIKIATKLPAWLIKSPADNMKYLDMQLKALQTDYVDFYLLHALGKSSYDNLKKNDIFKFIDQAKSSGKIKHIGFSFHAPYPEFDYIFNDYDWEFTQIQYNIIDRDYQAGEKGVRQTAAKNAGVVVMEPLRGGMITDVVKAAKDILNEEVPSRNMVNWALSWLFNDADVSTVLSGMSTLAQVKENIEIASAVAINSMPANELAAVNKASKLIADSIKVPCTACQYCMPCPFGVNIPGNFTSYNTYHRFEAGSQAQKDSITNYNTYGSKDAMAKNCTQCRACEEHCPQHIIISERMPEVAALFEK